MPRWWWQLNGGKWWLQQVVVLLPFIHLPSSCLLQHQCNHSSIFKTICSHAADCDPWMTICNSIYGLIVICDVSGIWWVITTRPWWWRQQQRVRSTKTTSEVLFCPKTYLHDSPTTQQFISACSVLEVHLCMLPKCLLDCRVPWLFWSVLLVCHG